VRLLIVGYGVMGRAVESLAVEAGHEVTARIDRDDPPITPEIGELADAAIEFSGPAAAAARVRELIASGLPVVSGSTGWSESFGEVADACRAHGGALLHAPNLSIGVALFERIVRRAATLLDIVPDYGLRIEETHHVRKVDHPSGTARWLAEGVVAEIERLDRWEGEMGDATPSSVDPDERVLRVVSHREGDVPGTHVVRAAGPDDVLELTHRALRRDGFARGAVRAVEWLRGRSGVFTLDDMLDDMLGPSDRLAPR